MTPDETEAGAGARAAAGAAPVVELQVVPLGECPRALAEALAARLSRHVRVPCRVTSRAGPAVEPRLAGRDQLDARALLLRLASPAGARGGVVRLGLTTRDLGLPVFKFIFGLARTDHGRAAVVSLARLDPGFYGLPADPETTSRRALGEMLHELGHVAGLRHCAAADCLMRFAGNVDNADARGGAFCRACRERLPAWLRPPGAAPLA